MPTRNRPGPPDRSARDSSEKPTARNERGLVANSPMASRQAANTIIEFA